MKIFVGNEGKKSNIMIIQKMIGIIMSNLLKLIEMLRKNQNKFINIGL